MDEINQDAGGIHGERILACGILNLISPRRLGGQEKNGRRLASRPFAPGRFCRLTLPLLGELIGENAFPLTKSHHVLFHLVTK